jgi:hypothetical protein
MCNQVPGFHHGFGNSSPRFQIVLILICVCIHTYFQAKLNSQSHRTSIGHNNTYVQPKLKVIDILSDGFLTDILRLALKFRSNI